MYRASVRFWDYTASGHLVRLTLRSTKPLAYNKHFSYHDEGWRRETVVWEWDQDRGVVTKSTMVDSTDCDGRHGDSYHCQTPDVPHCLASPLVHPATAIYLDADRFNRVVYDESINLPLWVKHHYGPVYDEFAQKMGY